MESIRQTKGDLLYCRGDVTYVHYPAYVVFALTGFTITVIDDHRVNACAIGVVVYVFLIPDLQFLQHF
jgi:hypothetical protein